MSGYVCRDLAGLDPWEASLQRSRARRRRAAGGRGAKLANLSPVSLAALIDARREAARDLADGDAWDLSLGRSRARRRAAQLRFVPASTRARRLSLGAFVALTAAPASGLLESSGAALAHATPLVPEPPVTTTHNLLLGPGASGRQVRLLQLALGIHADGVYGPATTAAVGAFQTSRGLAVDGVVGPATARALAVHAPPALSGATVLREVSGEASEPVPGVVRETALASPASSSAGSPGAVAPGAADAAAATASPEGVPSAALPLSGATGGAAAPAEAESSGGVAVPVVIESSGGAAGPGENEAAGAGETAGAPGAEEAETANPASASASAAAGTEAVRRVQEALRVPADGAFGPRTEAALRRLQARSGLPVDGVAGPATYRALGLHGLPELVPPASAAAGGGGPHGASGGGRHGGSSGAAGPSAGNSAAAGSSGFSAGAVGRLQEALHIPVDGTFGAETISAVRRFQETHGLAVDGVVGPSTWRALGLSGLPELHPPAAALGGGGGGGASSASGSSSSSTAAEGIVARVVAAADEIATRPYVYGGGHGSFSAEGYDCSGSVSYALHGGGLLSSPEDSSALESFGEPGPGRYITIYADSEHAWMTIDGRRFDTVALAETGNRWSGSMASAGGYVVRHPAGL
jgi:peptidoglycan hydrolase-like protein with peptidoglycan-binding domain